MATTKRPSPRASLAKNLQALVEASGMTGPEVAQKAGVDRKTVNNQLNGRYDPRPEQVQKVAQVFGFEAWQLLSADFNVELERNGKLRELIALYANADEEAREAMIRVARMAKKR